MNRTSQLGSTESLLNKYSYIVKKQKEIRHLQGNIPWPKRKRLRKKKKQESKTWKTLLKEEKDKEKKAERKSEKVKWKSLQMNAIYSDWE